MDLKLYNDEGKEIAVWEVSGHQECFELADEKTGTLPVVFIAVRPKDKL